MIGTPAPTLSQNRFKYNTLAAVFGLSAMQESKTQNLSFKYSATSGEIAYTGSAVPHVANGRAQDLSHLDSGFGDGRLAEAEEHQHSQREEQVRG